MRYLHPRPTLSDKTVRLFQKRTKKITASKDPRAASDKAWKNADAKGDTEARDKLKRMAPPTERCMYCESSEGVAVDHFRPRASYPERTFDWPNLLWACSNCNSNHKRDQFPLGTTGQPLLIDPTAVDPSRHLQLSPTTGRYVGRTAEGRESVKVFGLNRASLCQGRRDAVAAAKALVVHYDQQIAAGNSKAAECIRRSFGRGAHASLVSWVCEQGRRHDGELLVGADVVAALARRPELP